MQKIIILTIVFFGIFNNCIAIENNYLLPFTKKLLTAYSTISNCPKKYRHKIYRVGHLLREEILKYDSFIFLFCSFK